MTNEELERLQDLPIVFYDGTCGFCQASIQIALKYNKRQNLHFAALQSGLVEQLVPQQLIPDPLPDSILFLENGQLFTESEAALRIARHLNFPWSELYYFRFIPLSFRNFVYRFIAKHRYRIAGRNEACMLPSPEERARFVAY
ncbi:DCC1-like thiol-disulfide oxidoreductase family protein [Pontibacter sp. HSC-14F20]|uniref:thiol-disulfide oxidoreductase DCC family protein n=1 Tax=Pontibacter sp. HSC-14F20 TaxID=2864136 RepID=UPI001C73CBB9|nr:DCC1-like thiol-disulfide oxidoreductase family protein [Pontibacter sp. HSC-14F20]MBX0332616.1 DCC1-like thiol-disulfide oxidoreductase family protein [Pontibacter sp. HSC-14F20]